MQPYVVVYQEHSGEINAVEVAAINDEHAIEIFVSGNRDVAELAIRDVYQLTLHEWAKWTGMKVSV